MAQTIAVFIIVGLAAGYVIRNFYKKYQQGKTSQCSCGCNDCSDSPADCSSTIE